MKEGERNKEKHKKRRKKDWSLSETWVSSLIDQLFFFSLFNVLFFSFTRLSRNLPNETDLQILLKQKRKPLALCNSRLFAKNKEQQPSQWETNVPSRPEKQPAPSFIHVTKKSQKKKKKNTEINFVTLYFYGQRRADPIPFWDRPRQRPINRILQTKKHHTNKQQ